jgi:tetratricopeptide (TPR) repeat protein
MRLTEEQSCKAEKFLDRYNESNTDARAELLHCLVREEPAVHTFVLGLLQEREDPNRLARRTRKRANQGVPERYKLVHVIYRSEGRTVWKAVDRQGDGPTDVAVKVIHRRFAAPDWDGLEQIALLKGLDHDYLARTLDCGPTADGGYYIVSEWLDGGPLATKLAEWRSDRQGPNYRLLVGWMQGLAEALDLVYRRQRIVHGDLKPGNIHFSRDGVPKIIDWDGMVVLPEGKKGLTANQVRGTPGYRSPEQVGGGKIGPWTDVHGLGATIYHCLMGHPPFWGGSSPASDRSTLVAAPGAVADQKTGIAPELAWICLKCLRKEPQHRYASSGELAEDLGHFAAGQLDSIKARPPGLMEAFLEWRFRHAADIRRIALLGLTAILLLLVVLAGSWAFLSHQKSAEMKTTLEDTQEVVNQQKTALMTQKRRVEQITQELTQAQAATVEALQDVQWEALTSLFDTLRMSVLARRAVPSPGTEALTVERLLEDRLRRAEEGLGRSPRPDEVRPWLDLCKAQLALLRGKTAEALAILSSPPPNDRPPRGHRELETRFWFYRVRGMTLTSLRRWDEAVRDFIAAAKLKPTDGLVWAQLGLAQLGRNAPGEAIPALEKAKQVSESRPERERAAAWRAESKVLALLGHAYLQAGKPGEAIPPLAASLRLWNRPDRPRDEHFALSSLDLALALGRCGKHQEAQKYADLAVKTFQTLPPAPRHPDMQVNYAIALLTRAGIHFLSQRPQAGLPDSDEAIRVLDKLEDKPLLAEAYLRRSAARYKLGRIEGSVALACNLPPSCPPGLPLVPQTSWLVGSAGLRALQPVRLAGALADAQKAFRLFTQLADPAGQLDSRVQVLACHLGGGNPKAALSEVTEALSLAKALPEQDPRRQRMLPQLRSVEQDLRKKLGRTD